jgi:hypothetical protein
MTNVRRMRSTARPLFVEDESMRRVRLKKEAATCRQMATEFAGLPEEPFLLRIASELEEMALVSGGARGRR